MGKKAKVKAVPFILKMEFLSRLDNPVPTAIAVTIAPRRHIVEHNALHTSLVLGLFSKEGGWEGEGEKYSASQNCNQPASSTESSTVCGRAKLFSFLSQGLLKTMLDSLIH